jgi:hypothetical protein
MSKLWNSLDNQQLKGTEANGLKRDDYCKFCYDRGHLSNHDIYRYEGNGRDQMNKLKLSEKLIQDAVNILPTLNRWKTI